MYSLSPVYGSSDDVWALATRAKEANTEEIPRWRKVAYNVALGTFAFFVESSIFIGLVALAGTAFFVSANLGVAVVGVAILVALLAVMSFDSWMDDQYIDSETDYVQNRASQILDRTITSDVVAAFLSVQHLCSIVNLNNHIEGYESFAALDDIAGPLQNYLSSRSQWLLEDWLLQLQRPVSKNDLSALIVNHHLLLYWCYPNTRPLKEDSRKKVLAYEDEFINAVGKGKYKDDEDGRARFVQDKLPQPSYGYVICKEHLLEIIDGVGPTCHTFIIPHAWQDDNGVVDALRAKRFNVSDSQCCFTR